MKRFMKLFFARKHPRKLDAITFTQSRKVSGTFIQGDIEYNDDKQCYEFRAWTDPMSAGVVFTAGALDLIATELKLVKHTIEQLEKEGKPHEEWGYNE